MMTTADIRRTALLNDSVQDVRDCESRAVPAASPGRRRHRHCAAAWLGMMLALAGCTTVGPDFVQPKAPVLDAMAGGRQARSSRASPRSRSGGGKPSAIRCSSKLIEIAYRNNYNLKIAGLRVLQARAQLGIAVGYLYPQVQQANGSVNYTSASRNAANTEGRGPGLLGVQRRRQRRLGARFLGQVPALDRGGRRQPAGLRRRLRQRAGAARRAGRGHLRRHPQPPRRNCRSRARMSPSSSAASRSPRPGSAAATSASSTCCRRALSCWGPRRRSRRWRPGWSRRRMPSARCWAGRRETSRRFWARSRA